MRFGLAVACLRETQLLLHAGQVPHASNLQPRISSAFTVMCTDFMKCSRAGLCLARAEMLSYNNWADGKLASACSRVSTSVMHKFREIAHGHAGA